MKKSLLALLLAALAIAVVPATAQEPARDVDSLLADQRLKRMTTVLTLTDEQKTKVRPLVVDEIKAFKSYRADTSLTEEDRIKKQKEFRASSKPKFKAILSDEQFAKYEQLESEKRGKKPAKPAK
jgi:Spy/CpxP family protein refolding chaperone